MKKIIDCACDHAIKTKQTLMLKKLRSGKKQCFEIIAQKITAKNINNDLVFFRDEIKIFLISWFETRSRFVSSTSRASRRDREFVPSNLEFRDGDEILKKISCGRARYLVAKSHEIFRDRDISPCSDLR